MYTILYHEEVVKKDIPKISANWRKKIKVAIEVKLTTEPELYGKPLRHSLKNYRKLRVGDYRVVFKIQKSILKIIAIQHRSKVYSGVSKRL